MEFFTIFVASLMTLISPTGTVADQVAQRTIRSQFAEVEALQVRIDNAPVHQFLQGRVDRIRIAGKGLFPLKEIRIDELQIETDPIDVDFRRKGRVKLARPLNVASRVVLTEADLNRALASPTVTNWLRQVGSRVVVGDRNARRAQRFQFLTPKVQFQGDRLRFQISLQEADDPARLDISVETGLAVDNGRQFRLVNPQVWVNGDPVSKEVVETLTNGLPERTNLQKLEKSGILARVLRLQIQPGKLQLETFAQVQSLDFRNKD
uniref:DUF2993 domain-containing protein n=1 Tax=Oscillatoriales cyanobacterium SpSt-418 TaxID=2282169 RepID=A0A7C3KIG4_9CYAN